MAKSRRPAPARGPRDILSADDQHHQITGFRLTTTSAVELVVTVCLYTMSVVFLLLAFQGWRYGSQRGEANRLFAAHRLDRAAEAAGDATGNYGDDVGLLLLQVNAAIENGDFETAHSASEHLLDVAPHDPDAALARAVALLSDPSTAMVPSSREEARQLLTDAADRPDAMAALGQMALDDGNINEARTLFRRTVSGDSEDWPSTRACAIAWNGLGVCRLATDHAQLTTADVREAIDDFRRAMAYRQPWAPPMINRDRATAIWLRLAVAEADAQHGANPAALRTAMEEIEEAFQTEFGFIGLDRNVVGTGPRQFTADTMWPTQMPIRLRTGTTVSEVEQGRAKAEPMISNRQRYLLNALAIARSRRITAEDGSTALRTGWTRLREVFDEAAVHREERFAVTWNRVCAGLRVFGEATAMADRQMALGGGIATSLSEIVENIDELPVPADQRTPLIAAMYVAMSTQPDRFIDGRIANGSEMLALLERWDLLARIEASGGDRRPAPDWLQFQRDHLRHLRELHRAAAGVEPAAFARRALPWAARLAAALPVDTAPEEAATLVNPSRVGEGPLPARELRYLDVGLLVRLYEELLRTTVSAVLAHAARIGPQHPDHRATLETAREVEICRARLCGFLIANDGWCFGTVPNPGRILESARTNLTRIATGLGD